jgi:ethanolaminephosphotransferase
MGAGVVYRPQFSQEQLHALTTYKNRGADLSVTYKYVMSPLYDRLVHFLPLWLAPNAVTLIGFLLVLTSHAALLYHTPQLDTGAPPWTYIFVGVSLFTYMVLDNLDGRQARRTRSSSPLGHLFDHGCDAFNVTVSGVSFLATLQVGSGMQSYAILFMCGHFICYAASLEEYFTGAMILREINGPNEGLILMSILHTCTGFFGPQIWTNHFAFAGFDMPRNQWVGIMMSIPCALTVAGNYAAIWADGRRRNNSRAVLRRAVLASVSFLFFGVTLFAWAVFAPQDYSVALVPILWLSCLNYFYMISRMIICHLTNVPYPVVFKTLIPQGLCALNAVIGRAVLGLGRPVIPQGPLLAASLAFAVTFNLWRIYCMVSQICDHLNIQCFRLGPLRLPVKDDAVGDEDIDPAVAEARAIVLNGSTRPFNASQQHRLQQEIKQQRALQQHCQHQVAAPPGSTASVGAC